MRVFLYPEKIYAELGSKRWQISWEQLKTSGAGKVGDEIDIDSDIDYFVAGYPTQEEAREAAKKLLEHDKPYFGAVSLSEQVIDWFVQEDRVAEWVDCGRIEEIS